MSVLNRSVIVLSFVSLLTDIASEMLYPVMPVYLKAAGFSILFIGILEGAAEATAGLSKGYFGNLSDSTGSRVPFVRTGYALSAISKPLLAVSSLPAWIFLSRTIDRLGKGVRTAARDAMLADVSLPEHRARVFGFHRALDTTGALLGPSLSLIFLYYLPGRYRLLFLCAFVPGILAVLLTFLLRESRGTPRARPGLLDFLGYVRRSPREFRRLLGGLLFFTILNSSDAFIILLMKQKGLSDTHAILAYIFYNAVFAAAAYPAGAIADRIGPRRMLACGIFVFALVYAALPYSSTLAAFGLILALYGVYAAATEGTSKAWITQIVSGADTATAVGAYSSLQSICAILASSMAGLIWSLFGPEFVFAVSAGGAFIAAMYFSLGWKQ